MSAAGTTPAFDPGGTPPGTPSGAPPGGPGGVVSRIGIAHALARGWWLLVLRGLVAVLFGLLVLVFPLAGLGVVLGFLAAWFAVDGALTLWHAIHGDPREHRAWFAIEGIVSLVAAAVLLLEPATAALALVLVVGVWNIVTGVAEIVAAFRVRSWLLGLAGLASLLVGLYLVALPGPGLLALLWVVGLQAIVFGALLVMLGLRLRRVRET